MITRPSSLGKRPPSSAPGNAAHSEMLERHSKQRRLSLASGSTGYLPQRLLILPIPADFNIRATYLRRAQLPPVHPSYVSTNSDYAHTPTINLPPLLSSAPTTPAWPQHWGHTARRNLLIEFNSLGSGAREKLSNILSFTDPETIHGSSSTARRNKLKINKDYRAKIEGTGEPELHRKALFSLAKDIKEFNKHHPNAQIIIPPPSQNQ